MVAPPCRDTRTGQVAYICSAGVEDRVMYGCNNRDIARLLSTAHDHMPVHLIAVPSEMAFRNLPELVALLLWGKCLIYEKGIATRVLRILLTGIGFNRLVKVRAAIVEVPAGDQGLERCCQPRRWTHESILASREADPYLTSTCQTALWLVPTGCTSPSVYSLLLLINLYNITNSEAQGSDIRRTNKRSGRIVPSLPFGTFISTTRRADSTLSKPTTHMCCSGQ